MRAKRMENIGNMMKYEQIYQKTLDKWGREAQFDQAVEECAELIAVLKHWRRGKVNEEQVVDELADVWLMVGQLVYMFGEQRVSRSVEQKIDKLNVLLDQE